MKNKYRMVYSHYSEYYDTRGHHVRLEVRKLFGWKLITTVRHNIPGGYEPSVAKCITDLTVEMERHNKGPILATFG